MLSFPWLREGSLECTLLNLEGSTRNEEKSVDFDSGDKIPEITFSRGERFRFDLKIRKKGWESPLTKITSYSQQGELGLFVFLEGVQRASFSGFHTFSVPLQPPDLRTGEHNFSWDRVAIIRGTAGAVGWMKIELRFKLLT